MSTTTADKNLIIQGAPFLWLHRIKSTGGETPTYSLEELYRFDNLTANKINILATGETSSSGEYTDIIRIDKATWRYPKNTLILDGKDETDITPASANTDATKKAEVTFATQEASLGTDGFSQAGFTAFLQSLMTHKDDIFILTTATGYTYANYNTDVTKKPDGYFFMACKLTSNIDYTPGEPLSLTFSSNVATNATKAMLEASGTIVTDLYTPIALKKGGTGKDLAAVAPTKLTDANAQLVLDGDGVFDDIQTYTYV